MAVEAMDVLDRRLLNELQEGIELVERPYQALADKLGTTEEEVLNRVRALKGDVIRQISAIFDTRSLGYKSSLVAAKIPEERIDQAARVINEHPGVSHNYKRNHAYNLWFTIAVPPNSRLGLEKTVELLGKMAEAEQVRLMPTLKLFKIGVQLDMTGQEDMSKAKAKPAYGYEERTKAAQTVSDFDIAVIRELQKDLSVEPRPFDALAENIGVSTEELLRAGRELLERKQMRRFAAVLYHRKAGFRFNGMGVWAVPEEKADEIGMKMARLRRSATATCVPPIRTGPTPFSRWSTDGRRKNVRRFSSRSRRRRASASGMFFIPPRNIKRRGSPISPPEMDEWEEKVIRRFGI